MELPSTWLVIGLVVHFGAGYLLVTDQRDKTLESLGFTKANGRYWFARNVFDDHFPWLMLAIFYPLALALCIVVWPLLLLGLAVSAFFRWWEGDR